MQTTISAKLFSQGIWKEIRTAILIITLIPQIYLAQAVNPNPDMAVPDGTVKAIIVKGDYTYIGGEFDYVGKNSGYGVKVTTTGSTINPAYAKVNGTINACIPDGNEGWYIGGSFTKVGSTSISYLARIKSDGTLDVDWLPNAGGEVYCLALSGNDLYVGGNFATMGGINRSMLAKVSTATGLTDATWDPNADNTVRAMAIDNGWLYIGGNFTKIGGVVGYTILARVSLTGAGSADAGFKPDITTGYVNALAISGGYVFAGGFATTPVPRLCKISVSTGAVDGTWKPEPSGTVNALAINGDYLYVGGGFTAIGGVNRNHCAKLSTTGTGAADASWDPGPDNVVNSLAVTETDVYIGGYFTTVKGGTANRARIAKFSKANATLDPNWDPSVSPGSVNTIAISGSAVYLGGSFIVANSVRLPNLARINNLTGEVDPGWKPEPNGSVNALITDETYIYAGGAFTTVKGGTSRNNIARFSAVDGTADAWDPNINGDVNALLFDGTYIYAGGSFTQVNGFLGPFRNNIARFSVSVDATADPFWDPNINGQVNALEYDYSYIYAGGSFFAVNGGIPRNNIARFSVSGNGSVDEIWDPNIDGQVYALEYDGNFIYAGGGFYIVNGVYFRNNIARFSVADYGPADAWAPSFDGWGGVKSLAVSGYEIFVGGEFTSVNGTFRKGIAKISSFDGQLDYYWDPNLGDFVSIRAIAISDADVYLGGIFLNAGGNFQPNFALYTDRTLPVELVSFTSSVAGGVVTLNWQTATEVDNSGFEVQRAVAGSNNWTKMGFVDGHHTTNSPRYYSFRDQPSKTEGSKFRYRLKQIDNSGKFEFSNTIEVDLGSPVKFSLEQNYPNPFNPATVIQYQLPVSGNVAIDLYSASGEKITTLLSETKESGSHSFTFDAARYGLSSGIYFYRMTVITSSGEVFSSTRKLSLIK